ncbi:hypothetical protein ONZ45_g12816 [Pleurotus djamor]|nr:hypothetical protein ONZ45_g12816 [Pleurotus djamor]
MSSPVAKDSGVELSSASTKQNSELEAWKAAYPDLAVELASMDLVAIKKLTELTVDALDLCDDIPIYQPIDVKYPVFESYQGQIFLKLLGWINSDKKFQVEASLCTADHSTKTERWSQRFMLNTGSAEKWYPNPVGIPWCSKFTLTITHRAQDKFFTITTVGDFEFVQDTVKRRFVWEDVDPKKAKTA